MATNNWPTLEFAEIEDTLTTVHQWIQIIGKVQVRTAPWLNHSWHSTLKLTPRGLSTLNIPYQDTNFQIDLDFRKHQLSIIVQDKDEVTIKLEPMTVAEFCRKLLDSLSGLGIEVDIHHAPNEVEQAVPFLDNHHDKSYDKAAMESLWRALSKANGVFAQFRGEFIGKSSPVHLFWGAFDLAHTRFSGRLAPGYRNSAPNMPDDVMEEAYSQEVFSVGFWPGSSDVPHPGFYAYCYPEGDGFDKQTVLPEASYYDDKMGEYILPYEAVADSDDPIKDLLDFLRTTYLAGAKASDWDREALETDEQTKLLDESYS